MSLTVIDTVALALAPPSVALMVYVVVGDTAVGVPKIVPLLGWRPKPVGRRGLTVNVDSPCDVVGTTDVIWVPTENTRAAEG
jgi:hypothetical protein